MKNIEKGPLPPLENVLGYNPPVKKTGIRVWFNEFKEKKDTSLTIREFKGFRYFKYAPVL